MKTLRKAREARGLSQRGLAAKSGTSFRCVQQLEEPDHNWRVSSLRSVARAMDLPAGGLGYYVAHYFSLKPDSVEDISLRIYQDGFDSWKTHLFNFVDRFRNDQNTDMIERPPIEDLAVDLQALIASTVETLCDECHASTPPWCKGIPALDRPWFVSGIENLKAMALIESPTRFRTRNIFVLENFLKRA